MKKIVKEVLEEIKDKKLTPTPDVYEKIFFKKAKEKGIKIDNKITLLEYAHLLSESEQEEIKKLNIQDIDTLIEFLINKIREKEKMMLNGGANNFGVSNDMLEKIASLMVASLIPIASNNKYESELNNFKDKVLNKPESLIDESIQNDIKYFIEKRQEEDKKVINEATKKVKNLLLKLDNSIDNMLSSNNIANDDLQKTLDNLREIDTTKVNNIDFNEIKNTLIDINKLIQSKLQEVSLELIQEHSEVEILKNRIKTLEEIIKKHDKKKNNIDFITDKPNQYSYDEKLEYYEKVYLLNNQDFGVIAISLDIKKINDIYGWRAGNSILKTFSDILFELTNGFVARVGSDKFFVIVSCETIEELNNYNIQIRNYLYNTKFSFESIKLKVTNFSSVVALRSNFNTIEELNIFLENNLQ